MTHSKQVALSLGMTAVAITGTSLSPAQQGSLKMNNSTQPNALGENRLRFDPAPVVALDSQPPARLIVDSPLPEQLATGYIVIRYRAENMRILPVYGPAALHVVPRIGHLHITVDDSTWHWLDASGEPISINGLIPGPHKLLLELENPIHKIVDSAVVTFEIPERSAGKH
jgi:uncharacterized protein DUF6130